MWYYYEKVGNNKTSVRWAGLFAAVIGAFTSFTAGAATPITCDVAIVGGGPGGVHTAYKLATKKPALPAGSVCLFEKSDHLGGRVGNNFPLGLGGAETGTGGYRMYFNHYTRKLGEELRKIDPVNGPELVSQKSFKKLYGLRDPGTASGDFFTYDTKNFATYYNSPINDNDIWKKLLCGPQVPKDANNFPLYKQINTAVHPGPGTYPSIKNMTLKDYLNFVADQYISPTPGIGNGANIAKYLVDVWRFRGDFDVDNDATSYNEYNAKDFTGGAVLYAKPSYQAYFRVMEAKILANNQIIKKLEPVLSIEHGVAPGTYKLTTPGYVVTANKVVIATDQPSLAAITGDVADQIEARPEFNQVAWTTAVTVTHQYQYQSRPLDPFKGFWNTASSSAGSILTNPDLLYPSSGAPGTLLGAQLDPSGLLRRSTTNITLPGGYMINTSELPLNDYHDSINVGRSVYVDRPSAVTAWVNLFNTGGQAAVDAKVREGLRLVYPKIFTGVLSQEPVMVTSHFTHHDPAWYYLAKGAFAAGHTNQSIFDWSQNPLGPSEKVWLVGDSWMIDGSGWSDAAFKGSVRLLNEKFGFNIDPKYSDTIKCIAGDIVDPR